MTDELTVDGKVYISSKRAAQLSHYTQDYVGQLARAGHIDAQRIGGLWYVFLDSLTAYKAKADTFVPKPPEQPKFVNQPTDTLVTFDGKDYVSAARASEITGYNQDYVGQLARAGKVLSRQVGNRWYVHREGLLAHKEEKDRMLAAVQTDAVGIPVAREQIKEKAPAFNEPLMTYSRDDKALLPSFERTDKETAVEDIRPTFDEIPSLQREEPENQHFVPIRMVNRPVERSAPATSPRQKVSRPETHGKTKIRANIIAPVLAVTVLFFAAIWYFGFRGTIMSGAAQDTAPKNAKSGIVGTLGDVLERFVTTELIYKRQ